MKLFDYYYIFNFVTRNCKHLDLQSDLPNTANPIFPQALITVMLQVEAEQRFTAMQVLDHPWVNVSISSPCDSPEWKCNY